MTFTFWHPALRARFVASAAKRNKRKSRPMKARQGALVLEPLEDRLTPATLMVNTNVDVVNPADGTFSLRDAISAVNAGNANQLTSGEKNQVSGIFGANDTIEFSAALNGGTITLGGTALSITNGVTITGLGAGNLAISANNQSGVFIVASTAQVSITGLTIEHGYANIAPNDNLGGGIANSGVLTVSNCTFSHNTSASGNGYQSGNGYPGDGQGGGISNTGTLTVNNCTFSSNSATGIGGGFGGGIYNLGTATVINSTFVGNFAAQGGCILNDGTLTVTNSTLSGNSSSSSGVTGVCGGIYNQNAATLNNTIVANTNTGVDLYLQGNGGASFSGANDFIGDGSDLSSFTHSLQGNPLLKPLGNNGGPTQTMAPMPGSPVLSAGSVALAVDGQGNPLTTDQRGDPRIVGGAVAIGAFESQAMINPIPPQTVTDGSTLSLTVSASPAALTFSLGGTVPNGAVINAQTGVFTWTPTESNSIAPGVYSVTVVAVGTNDPSLVGTATFIVTVGPSSTIQGSGMAARSLVSLGLTQSAEYYTNFITAAYQKYLGRGPDAYGLAYWLNQMQNQGLTDEHLEAGIIGSTEYIDDHGGPGSGWVTGLYMDLLGRTPSGSEVQYWVNQLAAGVDTTDVAYGFATSRERESARVTADYKLYLGRNANPTEISYWYNIFQNGGINEQVIAGFISSQEYFMDHGNNIVDWLYANYRAVLGRNPDPNGYNYWLSQLQ